MIFGMTQGAPLPRSSHPLAGLTAIFLIGLVPATPAEPEVRDVLMPARGGVGLATSIYLASGDGPRPCVLARTPYGKDGNKAFARRFVERGYAFISQDCRGRFK